jgi:hypothetical protein
MAKRLHTLALHALECNSHVLKHVVRIQYQLKPEFDLVEAQKALDTLQETLQQMRAEVINLQPTLPNTNTTNPECKLR